MFVLRLRRWWSQKWRGGTLGQASKLGGTRCNFQAKGSQDVQGLILFQQGRLEPQGSQRSDNPEIGQRVVFEKSFLRDRLLQDLAAHQSIGSAGDPVDKETLQINPLAHRHAADTGAIGQLVLIRFSDE